MNVARSWVQDCSAPDPKLHETLAPGVSGEQPTQLQLELRPVEWDLQWRDFLRLLRAVVDAIGVKAVAFDLDVKPSVLVNALAERDHHAVKASWLPYLIAKAPNDEPLELLARLRGRDVVPAKPVTPEEELAALHEVLGESLSADLRAAVYAKARRRATERAR